MMFKEEWLLQGAVVPVDPETTVALVGQIKKMVEFIGALALTGALPASREWVRLTQQDWDDLYKAHHDKYGFARSALALGYEEAIEAKLKEKNT